MTSPTNASPPVSQGCGVPQASMAVVCLSGGMDSTSLLMHLLARGVRVFGVSFLYGQKHHLELQRLQANLDYLAKNDIDVPHHTVDMSILGQLFHSALIDEDWKVPEGFYEQENMKETVVPNRNAIFASIAYGYALSLANRAMDAASTMETANRQDSPDTVASANDSMVDSGSETKPCAAVALGVHQGDHAIYPDCRPKFYRSLWQAFADGNWDSDRVELYLPYLEGDKFTILQDAEESIEKLDLDFDTVFGNTSTSYEPDGEGRASGRTGADVERVLAFHRLGRRDPIPYVDAWDDVVAYAQMAESPNQEKPTQEDPIADGRSTDG